MGTCWLVDRRQSKPGQTVPTTSAEDTPAGPSAEHQWAAFSASSRLSCFIRVGFSAALRKAGLPQRSDNGFRG